MYKYIHSHIQTYVYTRAVIEKHFVIPLYRETLSEWYHMAAIGQFSEKLHQDTYYDRHKRTMSFIKLILPHFKQGGWTAAK